MTDFPQLALMLLLAIPLCAAILVAMLGPQQRDSIRRISLVATVVCLGLALFLAARFMSLPSEPKAAKSAFQFQPQFVPGSPGVIKAPQGPRSDPHGTSWNLVRVGNTAVQFYIGLDGLNVWLVVLTALLMVPSVLVSWEQIHERANEYYAWLLALETAMIGVFVAFDILLFYAFFELTLVPLFFLIGIWGGGEKRYAAGKFFIFTLTGSLITLLGVLAVVLACYTQSNELTFSIPRLVWLVNTRLHEIANEREFWYTVQFWVFLALIAGFSIKVPLVPLHTWLPLAHTEAPTAGSVLLAGVLLKIGSYGFLRLAIPLAPDASLSVGFPLISTMAAIGIVYGSLCAYAQTDIKKMVAYSSVSHLGLCMLAMFALNGTGLSGSVMVMLNHGLSTGLLFLLVGMLYERYHTREMSQYGGMARRLPLLAACMVFVCFTSVGLPGLNGFVGEALSIFGVVERHQRETPFIFPYAAVAAIAGVVLGAWYLLTMLQRVFFGETKEPEVMTGDGHGAITDLKPREWAALAPLLAVCLLIGVWPQPVLDTMRPALQTVESITENARERHPEAHHKPLDGLAHRQPEEPQP